VKQIRKRLTYANVMSSVAIFLVLGGATALAAGHLGKNTVGSKQLKKNAVTTAKIKKNAVTSAKIKSASVTSAKIKAGSVTGSTIAAGSVTGANLAPGTVTGANLAPGTVGAGNLAAGSVGNAQTQVVKVFKGGAVPAAADVGSAPKIGLGSVGPFKFYGKCFVSGTEVEAVEYIELTSGQATLGGEDSDEFAENSEGYLTPSSPEEDRELKSVSTGPNDFDAASSDEEFQASATDGTEITGEASGIGAKEGSPSSGNGPFLAGDSCIIGAISVFGS
jgi:hypothetical protein